MDLRDPLRHYKHYQQSDSPYAGGSSFMERVSEAVASGMGTVGFLLISSGIILAEPLNQLTEEVHNAICVARATHPVTPASESS
jgi:hypothetical protein